MKRILYLLFFIIINQLIAQPIPATITFIGGKTFEGFADINKKSEIEFRLELTDQFEIYDGNDFSRIEFNEDPYNIYEYVSVNKKIKLLKVLSEGEITAYELDIFSYSTKKTPNQIIREENRRIGNNNGSYMINHNGFGTISTYNGGYTLKKIKYYLKKNNIPVENIKHSFKKKAEIYFENCPGLLRKIKSNEYKYHHMKSIVDYYNDFCTEI